VGIKESGANCKKSSKEMQGLVASLKIMIILQITHLKNYSFPLQFKLQLCRGHKHYEAKITLFVQPYS
jgi:hypothetical protein